MYSVNNGFASVDLNVEPLSEAQVQQRIKKGLKIDDRFADLIKSNPSKLQQIYDHHTTSKIPMDVETTGKPNHLVSFFGVTDELPVMASLSDMS